MIVPRASRRLRCGQMAWQRSPASQLPALGAIDCTIPEFRLLRSLA